jgi:hypothetical protein
MGEECESKCIYFGALARIDESLAILNRRAREEKQQGKESDGSPGLMCVGCVAKEKINAALDEKANFWLEQGS